MPEEKVENVDYSAYVGSIVGINYDVGGERFYSAGELVEITDDFLHCKSRDEKNFSVKINSVVSIWEL